MNVSDRLSQMPRQKALVIGVIVGLLYYLIAYDNGEKYEVATKAFQGEARELEIKIKGIDKRIVRANEFKATVDELGGQLEKFVSYIPSKFGSVDLMRVLSTEAKAAGTNIIRIVEQNSGRSLVNGGSEFYDEMEVKLELEGTYAQFVLFLSYLTRIDKIVTVEDMSIVNRQREQAEESPVLQFKSTVKGYRYREASQK